MATVTHRDYVQKVFEVQCECALKSIELLAAAVGDRVAGRVRFRHGFRHADRAVLFGADLPRTVTNRFIRR